MLIKTTKLLPNIFETLRQIIDSRNENAFSLQNKNLLVIFFDKIVKLLHVALMHPKDYTTEVLSKFLNGETPASKQRNWVYITEMFRMINELGSTCSYIYGQVDVKLGLIRFIAELLVRLDGPDSSKQEKSHCLDEMVQTFSGERYFDENQVFSREELRTYGSLILIEMGMVFKALYLEKDQKAVRTDSLEDYENYKIDITIALSVLLSKSKSAKAVAIE